MLAFASCENTDIDPRPDEQEFTIDPLEYIESLGFDITSIEELEDCYRVEGDVLFPKNYFTGVKSRQTWSGQLVSDEYVRDIKIFYDNNHGNENWEPYIIKAIEAWNSIEACKLKFRMVEWNQEYDINIRFGEGHPNILMDAPFPSEGKPGAFVRINRYSPWRNYSFDDKVGMIVHELGHTLGLRHTDWVRNGETTNPAGHVTAVNIYGTPYTGNDPTPTR